MTGPPSPPLEPARRGGPGESLILFVRRPEAGQVKTRLAPLLGAEGAALLHAQMAAIAFETAGSASALRGVAVEARWTGGEGGGTALPLRPGFASREQGEGDLGARLRRAVDEAFAGGRRRVAVIGTDCPLLSVRLVGEAFDALETHDVVLGPAADGGYYLIGLNRAHPGIFEEIPWGGPEVLARTREAADRLGLRIRLLAPLPDVDRPEDLEAWGRARAAGPEEAPRLSVIIPARNEENRLAAALASVFQAAGAQAIVVDGQSGDRTAEIARRFGAEILSAPASRGVQMNLGA